MINLPVAEPVNRRRPKNQAERKCRRQRDPSPIPAQRRRQQDEVEKEGKRTNEPLRRQEECARHRQIDQMSGRRFDWLVAPSKQDQHSDRISRIETQHVKNKDRVLRWLRTTKCNRGHRNDGKDNPPIRDCGLSRRVINLGDYWFFRFPHYSKWAPRVPGLQCRRIVMKTFCVWMGWLPARHHVERIAELFIG